MTLGQIVDGFLQERAHGFNNALRRFRLLGIVPAMQATAGIERVGAVNIPALLKDRVPAHFPLTIWPEDNEPTAAGVALGKRLFHDTRLSINNTQSCASCHHQAAAFAEPLAVSRGAEGQNGSRNAMPLFNLAWKPGFFWDGRAPTLRDQVLRPIQDPLEMHETRFAQNTSLVVRVQRITETTFLTAEDASETYGEASALMLAASTATIARTLFDRNEGGATGALIQAVSASAIALSNSVMRQNGAGRWRIYTSSLASGYATNASLIHLGASHLHGMNCSLIFNEPATNMLVAEEGAQFAWVNSIVQSYGTAPDIALAFSMSHCCLVDPQFSEPGLLFANPALRQDGRLTAGSPCIDAGTASGAPTIDLDGEARWDDPAHPNLSSFVDIGADEWVDLDSDSLADFWESENYGSTGIVQGVEDDDHDGLAVLGEYEWGTNPFLPDSDGDWMPDGWEVENGLPALTGNGQDDADDDSFCNVDEFVALTDPKDYLSYFRVEKIVPAAGAGASIEWLGRSNRIYGVWQSDDLATWSNVYQVAGVESVLSFTNADSEAGAQYNRVTVVRP